LVNRNVVPGATKMLHLMGSGSNT